jgi:hypothetical protein
MKTRYSVFLFVSILLCARGNWAQISPGAVVRYDRQSDDVLFRMTNGRIRVQVCTPSMVHVVYSPNGTFPHEPDPNVLQSSWPAAQFSVDETGQKVTVSTSKLRVTLLHTNGAVSFTDARGKMLLSGHDFSRAGSAQVLRALPLPAGPAAKAAFLVSYCGTTEVMPRYSARPFRSRRRWPEPPHVRGSWSHTAHVFPGWVAGNEGEGETEAG